MGEGLTTGDIIIMLIICAVVAVLLVFVLLRFIKRLKVIEVERWGDKADRRKKVPEDNKKPKANDGESAEGAEST